MKLFSSPLRTALLFGVMAIASIALWSSMPSRDTTIEIRVTRQGSSLPDGFYVWHHLDANGIIFKSIIPQDNNLLITFASSAQSEAAKEVLHRALPGSYAIDEKDNTHRDEPTWRSILGVSSNHA